MKSKIFSFPVKEGLKKTFILFFIFLFSVKSYAQIINSLLFTEPDPSVNNNYWIAMDGSCNLYVSLEGTLEGGFFQYAIVKIDPNGTVSNFVGTGSNGYSGDGGHATAAEVWGPRGMVFDATGNFYFCDELNEVIRKVTPAGIISTIAGLGAGGSDGPDGIQATACQLNDPEGIAIDPISGNLFFSENASNCIRTINSSGIISTYVNHSFTTGYTGDGGPATAATLKQPEVIPLKSKPFQTFLYV